MKTAYKDSIEYKTIQRLNRLRAAVLLREDFEDLGSYRQISRVLRVLIQKGKLAKIGQGLFVKAYPSSYSDTPLIKGGFDTICREALNRLNIEWEPGSAEQAYNNGESTQIPAQNIVKLKSRLRRKIQYRSRKLIYEKQINAR